MFVYFCSDFRHSPESEADNVVPHAAYDWHLCKWLSCEGAATTTTMTIFIQQQLQRERGERGTAKPLCVPLPILNIYAYKAGILSYNNDRSVELRFKLQTWVGQLNVLVRILLRTSFPLFYVNRYTPIPHTFRESTYIHQTYIISDSGSPSSRRTSRLTLTLIENMKCDISQHR